jgi:hypothetical protein
MQGNGERREYDTVLRNSHYGRPQQTEPMPMPEALFSGQKKKVSAMRMSHDTVVLDTAAESGVVITYNHLAPQHCAIQIEVGEFVMIIIN